MSATKNIYERNIKIICLNFHQQTPKTRYEAIGLGLPNDYNFAKQG